MAKPKEGDTRGWNKKTGTGYKWKGGKWVQYKNNKPHGPFKGHGGITGNVDVVGGLKSQGGRLLRTIAGLPDDEQIKSAQKAGERYRANNKNKTKTTNNKNKGRNALSIFSPKVWRDTKRNIAAVENPSGKDSSKTTSKSKNRNKLTFMQGVKAGELMKKDSSTKSTTKTKPKDEWKPTAIQKKLMKGGWTKEELQAKQAKHKKWKADRKAGKLKTEKFDPRGGKGQRRRLVKDDKANTGSGRKGDFGKGTYGKGLPSNPQLKTQTVKDDRDPNRHLKIKKKKKKNVPLGTNLSKMFD